MFGLADLRSRYRQVKHGRSPPPILDRLDPLTVRVNNLMAR